MRIPVALDASKLLGEIACSWDFRRFQSHSRRKLLVKFVAKLIAYLTLAGACASWSVAQQAQPATGSDSSPQTQQLDPPKDPPSAAPASPSGAVKDAKQNAGQAPQSGTSNDRLFFTLPNFLTLENAGRVPPLTTEQKFGVVARGSFDPVIFAWYGLLTSIAQAENSEPAYGQGWGAFGKRYATNFADGTIENFMTGAIMPTVLRQDPRYFQMGQGSFTHRAVYAMSRNLITRDDSGKSDLNYSEVVGGALSASISTYGYHPTGKYVTTMTPGVLQYIPSDRTLSNTAKVWGTQYAYDTLTLVVKEFWPDIRRAMLHKHPSAYMGVDQPKQ